VASDEGAAMTVSRPATADDMRRLESEGRPQLPPAARSSKRHRRPSGAPPPLPRNIGRSGKGWLIGVALLLSWVVVIAFSDAAKRATDRADAAVLRQFVRIRTEWLTDVMAGVSRAGSGWGVTLVSVAALVALMFLKRWRHVFTFVGSLLVLALIGSPLQDGFARPRPYDVAIIGRWAGYSLPAPPVAVVTWLLIAITYSFVPAGPARRWAKLAVAAIVLLLATSALYLGTYHPFDLVLGIAMATAVTVNAFRFFTPNDVFPVTYRRGKTAHLNVDGERGAALRHAVQEQLGLTVLEIKPVGLAGSGGSTPLRIRVEGDPDTYVFGKLYAMNHVRADRWYKLGRLLLYGRLEDEAPFQSVRRLVEYEDYTARLLRDVGIPTAAAYGIVEMTPEREYLLVTEFFDGAKEIGEAEVDDGVIDEGLMLVRKLWDAGLAHRDIKPANLLVRDGHVLLIDVAFVQVRPSPWRQAIDLANMMLVLAVRTDAARVYERAQAFFTPDEIAEAFAATRGAASPSQLRAAVKADGRDLLKQFRALAPSRRPISLQRWNPKRIGLVLALLIGFFLTGSIVGDLLSPSYSPQLGATPHCGTSKEMILMAQAVPSATAIPCIANLPAGWSMGHLNVSRNRASFGLNSDRGGDRALEATLQPPERCSVAGATEVASDEPGMRRYERVERLPPHLRSTRYYLFDGGCVTYAFALDGPTTAALIFDGDRAMAFQPRRDLVAKIESDSGLRLCGAGVSCPGDP
jgi:hypothetical protein